MAKHPHLESVLARLVNAENRTEFAETHGLKTRDGRVLVVIELEANATLPEEFGLSVTSRFEGQVQAYVAIEDLFALADSEGVRLVRTPTELQPHDLGTNHNDI